MSGKPFIETANQWASLIATVLGIAGLIVGWLGFQSTSGANPGPAQDDAPKQGKPDVVQVFQPVNSDPKPNEKETAEVVGLAHSISRANTVQPIPEPTPKAVEPVSAPPESITVTIGAIQGSAEDIRTCIRQRVLQSLPLLQGQPARTGVVAECAKTGPIALDQISIQVSTRTEPAEQTNARGAMVYCKVEVWGSRTDPDQASRSLECRNNFDNTGTPQVICERALDLVMKSCLGSS